MNTEPIFVAPTLDLQHWVDYYVYRLHRKSFPVVADGHLQGLVTTRDLGRCPREEWSQHSVAEVMHKDVSAISIAPDAEALVALRKMQRAGTTRLLVTDSDHLLGIVTMNDLLGFFRMKMGFDQFED